MTSQFVSEYTTLENCLSLQMNDIEKNCIDNIERVKEEKNRTLEY
jgi:hypothetical protein